MERGAQGGRFTTGYERSSILDGISVDLTDTVGQQLYWWRYDAEATVVDAVYDVAGDGYAQGRRYHDPITVPTVSAVIIQGQTVQNDRGFYNTDTLRATINLKDVELLLGNTLSDSLNDYLLDRIVYKNEVFTITKLYPRGLLHDKYTMLTLDANQVNPEQLVNDPQFQEYAH